MPQQLDLFTETMIRHLKDGQRVYFLARQWVESELEADKGSGRTMALAAWIVWNATYRPGFLIPLEDHRSPIDVPTVVAAIRFLLRRITAEMGLQEILAHYRLIDPATNDGITALVYTGPVVIPPIADEEAADDDPTPGAAPIGNGEEIGLNEETEEDEAIRQENAPWNDKDAWRLDPWLAALWDGHDLPGNNRS